MNMFRFPTKLSVVLVAVGSVTAIAGAAVAAKIFVEPGGGWMKIGGAMAVAIAGLLVIACAEIVGVVFALEEGIKNIEGNTRRTNEFLERHLAGEEKTPVKLERPRAGRM